MSLVTTSKLVGALVAFAALTSCYSTAWAQFPTSPVPPPGQLTLTILHDNDLHGHLFPFAYTEVGKSNIEQPSRGGAARRATMIRRLRKEIKNPTILIDSGDLFTRGPLCNAYEGIADVQAMNTIGYDLAAVGNNEFKAKDGVDQDDSTGAQAALLRVVKRSRFPWICANATDAKGEFLEGVQPYVVRDFNGVRVGFLGLTAPRSAYYPQTKGWAISDDVAAAKEWIPKARAECDILIAVTHVGVDLDKQLVAQTSGLDAIVGGDSHTFLYKAVEVSNTDGVKVPIVQDGEFGVDLGRFDLHVSRDTDGHWHLASYEYVLLPVDPSTPEAPDVNTVLAPYVQPFNVIVGHLSSIGETPAARSLQSTQIVVDALRQQTGADLAFNPDGTDFFNVFHHRDVTRYDVYAALPFHDNAAIASMTGAQIHELLKAHTDTVASGDIQNLDDTKTYRVAFVNFVASSVYKIPGGQLQDTKQDVRLAVIAALQETLKPTALSK